MIALRHVRAKSLPYNRIVDRIDGMERRAFLRVITTGVVAGMSRRARAQSRSEREHRIDLDVPLLSEEPASVPIRVGVEHPMEPDHYIQSIEVSIERDPVPAKGKFLFLPANGRAWVAYQMRSGTGGLVKAVAVCSRHGEFVASREVRVVEGGCSTPPERGARDRVGSPELRLPRAVKLGEPFEVRARVIHGSHTGLVAQAGAFRPRAARVLREANDRLARRPACVRVPDDVGGEPEPVDPLPPQGDAPGDPTRPVREQRRAALGSVTGDPRMINPPRRWP